MAFKREGDDGEWLSVLKNRRVAELLGENIPEDEILLMKNGRLCCLVCHHRPVFDTLPVLHVHRSGKKHEINAERFHADKNEVFELLKKRQHEEYIKTGKVHTVGPSSMSDKPGKAWLGCAPYDPRVKKCKSKPYERRPALQLQPSSPSDVDTVATATALLPEYTKNTETTKIPQTISEYRQLQNKKGVIDTPVKPYIGKAQQIAGQTRLNHLSERECKAQQTAGQTRLNHLSERESRTKPSLPPSHTGCKSWSTSVGNSVSGGQNKLDGTQLQFVHKPRSQAKMKKKPVCLPVSPEREAKLQKMEHYLMARGAGWRKDWDGKWIKDEDAEFDSDEEPPDLP